MSFTNMSFKPVWHEGGKCPGDKRHFKGAAREVYGYIRLLAKRNDGFVFAKVPNITEHTKIWASKNGKSFSQPQCERIMRAFRELGILSERCTRTIRHRTYHGWQFYEHDVWAESSGGMCEFKRWERYEKKYQYLMGNEKLEDFYLHDFQEENDGVNDGSDDGANDGVYDGESASNDGTNDGVNDGVATIVSVPNTRQVNEMRAVKSS
jgi:hypothetical protein